jgi:hypothetical protein
VGINRQRLFEGMMEYYQRCRQAAQYLDANIPASGFRHIVLSAKLDSVSYVSPVCPECSAISATQSAERDIRRLPGPQAHLLASFLRTCQV